MTLNSLNPESLWCRSEWKARPQRGSRGYEGLDSVLQRNNGAAEVNRTPDPVITNDVLYH